MDSTKRFVGEKYNLKWNSYKNTLIHYLSDHLAQEQLVDVTLACEGRYVRAHKLILSACSTFFKELFQIHKGDNAIVILNNVKFEELKYVIDFIYNGEIRVLDSDLEGVLVLGNHLKIKGLSNIKDRNHGQKNDENLEESTSETTQDESYASFIKDIIKGPTVNEKKSAKDRTTKPRIVANKRISNKKPRVSVPEAPRLPMSESMETLDSQSNDILREGIRNKASSNGIETDTPTPEIKKRKIIITKSKESDKVPLIDPESVSTQVIPLPAPIPVVEVLRDSNKEKVLEQPDSSVDLSKDPSTKVADSGGTPVRCISAFMIFANEWRKRLAVEHPDETNKQISVRLSSMWKNLSDETRDTFYEAASKANAMTQANSKNHNKSR